MKDLVKRYLQFAAGVLLIALPVASAVMFGLTVALQTKAQIDEYRGLPITVIVSLGDILALVLLVILAIAGAISGFSLLRRSREGLLAHRVCQRLFSGLF
jgi:hypothetical protein